MQVTPFGWVFMPLLLAVAIWARPWLLGLVLGSAVFQAAAVVNVPVGAAHYGISPYVVSAGVAGLVALLRWLGPDKSPISPPVHVRTPALWLLSYAAIAVAGSFVLPHVFAGLPVQPPLDPNGYSLQKLPPLAWTISNGAQAFNLSTHVIVALFLWQSLRRHDWSARKTVSAFIMAAGVALVAGLHDRGALMMEWSRMAAFWMSNTGYALVDNVPYHIHYPIPAPDGSIYAELYRISSPFSEPSYGSAFMAAVYAGLLAAFLFSTKKRMLTFFGLLLFALGLLNTFGSTGWVAGFGVTAILLVTFAWPHFQSQSIKHGNPAWPTLWRLMLAAVIISGITLVALWQSSLWRAIPTIGDVFIFNKAANLKNDGRFLSDMRAIALTHQTNGLGVGMGSNRTSSFLTSLLSNTGLAGMVAFLSMLGTLMTRFINANRLNSYQYFALAALGACVAAVSLSIPDLNLPFFWAFVFLAFALCPTDIGKYPSTGSM